MIAGLTVAVAAALIMILAALLLIASEPTPPTMHCASGHTVTSPEGKVYCR